MKKIVILVLVGVFAAFFLQCSRKAEVNSKNILVRVADREITVDEFIRRAEYTIRPRYARGNTNIDKKIIFNSLVAEKMLALEAGDGNKLANSVHFQRYIRGRKEQAMREWLYYREGVKKVKLDTSEIKRVYAVAGRVYRVQYLSFFNKANADSISRVLKDKNISIEQLIKETDSKAKAPEREVKFDSPEVDQIHKALYSDKLSKGDLIGPLKIDAHYYMILQVKGWINRAALSDRDIRQRVRDVKAKLTQIKATEIYARFASELMRGKRLDFNPHTYKKMVDFLKPIYFTNEKERKNKFLDNVFDRKREIADSSDYENKYQKLKKLPFFEYDGKVWTVEEFMIELEKHPLVFRRRDFSAKEFPQQLRLSVADLLRDRELTKVAYDRGYDRVPSVRQYVQMWRDALIAQYQTENILKQHGVQNPDSVNVVKAVKNYLDPYVAALREKYKDQIEVNISAYDSLKLTRIDMFAWQTNVPFPIIVPSFPRVTMYNRLDYGKKMKLNN